MIFELRSKFRSRNTLVKSLTLIVLKTLFQLFRNFKPFPDLWKKSPYGDFEEHIAIAQYDGCQNEAQAECIAYQDAFISVLNAVP